MSSNTTAGKGTPYWYEWSVGLLRVVDMLYADSGISSVTFQETGVKGWDDVVVRFADGKIEFIQVKHSREDSNLTFGDLVSCDDDGGSLLKSLYDAWVKLGYKSTTATCRVFTNRDAGRRKHLNRPPLLKFFDWLKSEAKLRKSIADFQPPKELMEGWREWLKQLGTGTDEDRLDFLCALMIETSQPDLGKLGVEINSRLAKALGISDAKATPLFHALDSALRRWTDDKEQVTLEDAIEALALPDEMDVLKAAPAPPVPFFTSREKRASELEQLLVHKGGPQIIFLSATPGAGKTSLMSRLEMRRSDDVFGGVIDLRYFAFRPITPEQHAAPSDSDFYVDPKGLWYSLLTQLRGKLKGKLAAYAVPVRNELLGWSEAREHVLRIANRLGQEIGGMFTIAIDGIDHAARAGRLRYEPGRAHDFFRSLPTPDELSSTSIRVLIAGQPAVNYQEYPPWLRHPDPGVKQVTLEPLTRDDIASLLREKGAGLPLEDWEGCLDAIEEGCRGNTLAVVFAVAEAKTCGSLVELRRRLEDRKLHDGLEAYYSSIWRYALDTVTKSDPTVIGIKEALAGTLCLIREPVNGAILKGAFGSLGLSADQWNLVLRKLGPLVVAAGNGYQVIHNDLRVFLMREIGGQGAQDLAWTASNLADYYKTATSGREVAQASLHRLLQIAGKSSEWARIFNVDWVFEAAALSQPFMEIKAQGKAALKAAIELEDWDCLHEVTCAIECLERWENNLHDIASDETSRPPLSPFFPLSEVLVPPYNSWTLSDLQRVTRDVGTILDAGEAERAAAVLDRWLHGLSINQLADRFYLAAAKNNPRAQHHNHSVNSMFESLGEVCRDAGYVIEADPRGGGFQTNGVFYFEKGWGKSSCETGPYVSVARCFLHFVPRFFSNREHAIRTLAERGQWRLVRRLLRCSHKDRTEFSEDFRQFAAWWCLRSGAEKHSPGWLESLEAASFGPANTSTGSIDGLLALARGLGWRSPACDVSQITSLVFSRSSFSQAGTTSIKVLIRGAALLGQAEAMMAHSDDSGLRVLIPPSEIRRMLEALWSRSWMGMHDPETFLFAAGDFAAELVEVFAPLGDKYTAALVDAALPIAVLAPGDFRAKGAWLALRRAGRLPELREWAKKVLGEDGWLWSEEYSSRGSLGDEFLSRASEIGESGLIAATREKLRWQRIGYRGNEDHSFRAPYYWFSELVVKSEVPVMNEAYHLLSLSEACEARGGDNRWTSDIHEAAGAAAIAAGPEELFRLIFSNRSDRGTSEWLSNTKHLVLGGFAMRLASSPPLELDAKIALWCLSIGLSRWFENADVTTIAAIRDRLLALQGASGDASELKSLLLRISPGEAIREPSAKEDDDADPEEWIEDPGWEAVSLSDGRLSPGMAVSAVRELNRRNEPDRDLKLKEVLSRFGPNTSQSGGWGRSRGLKRAIGFIAESVPGPILWSLAKAAISPAEEDGYWYAPVRENLGWLLLAKASTDGAPALKAGFERVIRMHERWARGGDMSLPLHLVQPAEGPGAVSWEYMTAKIFTDLLSSSYGVVIESCLNGTHALVSWRPSVLPALLTGCLGHDRSRKWILALLEVWAVERPKDLLPIETQLEALTRTGRLSIRLQAWIVRQLLAVKNGDALPDFQFINAAVGTPQRIGTGGILHTEGDIRGSFRFMNIYESANSRLHRIKAATGLDLSWTEPHIGSALLARESPEESTTRWQESIGNSSDFKSQDESIQAILDDAIDPFMADLVNDRENLLRFAQGALTSDEGWILRNSPIPLQDMSQWPTESQLEGNYPDPPSDESLCDLLAGVAAQAEINDDEIVIAACFKAYSWREDLLYHFWFAEAGGLTQSPKQVPSTLSGRTFPWMLNSHWWEPHRPEGVRTATFMAGSQQLLIRSFPEMMPSRLWVDSFGWSPSPASPFNWMSGDQIVVRFELRHGPPLNHSREAGRQALLHRWIAKKSAFSAIMESIPLLKPLRQFARFPFKET